MSCKWTIHDTILYVQLADIEILVIMETMRRKIKKYNTNIQLKLEAEQATLPLIL